MSRYCRSIAGVDFTMCILGGRLGLVGPHREKIHLARLRHVYRGNRWAAFAVDHPVPRPVLAVGRTQVEVVHKLLALAGQEVAS